MPLELHSVLLYFFLFFLSRFPSEGTLEEIPRSKQIPIKRETRGKTLKVTLEPSNKVAENGCAERRVGWLASLTEKLARLLSVWPGENVGKWAVGSDAGKGCRMRKRERSDGGRGNERGGG